MEKISKERIMELIMSAAKYASEHTTGYPSAFEGVMIGRYTELIALECANICEQQRLKILNNPNDPSWTEHLAECQTNIKTYFGVQ